MTHFRDFTQAAVKLPLCALIMSTATEMQSIKDSFITNRSAVQKKKKAQKKTIHSRSSTYYEKTGKKRF